MPIRTSDGEILQTEAEHADARCIVCRTRINVPLDPYCCVVCMNSDLGRKREIYERMHRDKVLMDKMRRKAKKSTVKRRKLQ